jgi:hypothetical protein
VSEPRSKRSLFHLLTELPHLFGELIRAEVEQLRMELIQKLKGTGIGLGLFILALNFLTLFLMLVILAGVFALSLVVPLWASALIIAGVALVLAVVFVLIGAVAIKTGGKPVPSRTIQSVRDDIATIRGDRHRNRSAGSD